ncbi:glycine cleavage system transcriptional repressor [Pseudomonas sp. Marseille-QA0892]
MEHLVFTVIAQDQPGLVERLAGCVAGHGGNWLESRMVRMADQFAGLVEVSVEGAQRQPLVNALQSLDDIRVLVAPSGQAPVGDWKSVRLELVGNDRAGIVRDITRLLAGQGVNVESLSTDVVEAPMSGEPLFQCEAILAVPAGLALPDLQQAVETLADELMVELTLSEDA